MVRGKLYPYRCANWMANGTELSGGGPRRVATHAADLSVQCRRASSEQNTCRACDGRSATSCKSPPRVGVSMDESDGWACRCVFDDQHGSIGGCARDGGAVFAVVDTIACAVMKKASRTEKIRKALSKVRTTHAAVVLQTTTILSSRCFLTKSGRGERIRTSGLYVPNVALYQAKLHPDFALWTSPSSLRSLRRHKQERNYNDVFSKREYLGEEIFRDKVSPSVRGTFMTVATSSTSTTRAGFPCRSNRGTRRSRLRPPALPVAHIRAYGRARRNA